MSDRELRGEVVVDTSGVRPGLAAVAQSLADVERAGDRVGESFGRFVDASGRLREANGRFVGSAKEAQKATEGLSGALGDMAAILSGPVGVAYAALGATLDVVGSAMDLFVDATKVATVAVGALAAAGGAAVAEYAKFESAFARVTTIMDDGTTNARELSDQVRDLAVRFGVDAVDAAKALADIIGAGIDEKDAIGVLTDAVKGSVAGFSSAAQFADVLTSALNSFGLSASQSGRIADVLFRTVDIGKTRIDVLTTAIGRVAPIAAQAGLSIEETGAAIATLTQRMTTAQATTAFIGLLNSIQKPAAESADALREMGVTAQALHDVGLVEVMERLGPAAARSDGTINALLGDTRAVAGAAVLAGSGLSVLSDALGQMNDAAGATDRAFAIVEKTLTQQFAVAVETVTDIIRTLGQVLSPFAAEALAPIIRFAQATRDEFFGLREVVEQSMGGALDAIRAFGSGTGETQGLVTLALDAIADGMRAIAGVAQQFSGVIDIAADIVRGFIIVLKGLSDFISNAPGFPKGTGDAQKWADSIRAAADQVDHLGERVRAESAAHRDHTVAIEDDTRAMAENAKAAKESADVVQHLLDEEKDAAIETEAISDQVHTAAKRVVDAFKEMAEADAKRAEKYARQREQQRQEMVSFIDAIERENAAQQRAAQVTDRHTAAIVEQQQVMARGVAGDDPIPIDQLPGFQANRDAAAARRRAANDAGAGLFGINAPSFGIGARPSGGSSIFGLGSFDIGGYITHDQVANVHQKEFVLPPPATQALGPAFLEALRGVRGNLTISPNITIHNASRVPDVREQARAMVGELTRATRYGLGTGRPLA